MHRQMLGLVAFLAVASNGCAPLAAKSFVKDHSLYETGELRTLGGAFVRSGYGGPVTTAGFASEYFKDGRLRSEAWSLDGQPVMKLSFYETGRLKSEQRLRNGETVYGVFYNEDGSVQRQIGEPTRLVSDSAIAQADK